MGLCLTAGRGSVSTLFSKTGETSFAGRFSPYCTGQPGKASNWRKNAHANPVKFKGAPSFEKIKLSWNQNIF
jgi:hypothetical protein